MAGGWNQVMFKLSFNPNHYMVLWFLTAYHVQDIEQAMINLYFYLVFCKMYIPKILVAFTVKIKIHWIDSLIQNYFFHPNGEPFSCKSIAMCKQISHFQGACMIVLASFAPCIASSCRSESSLWVAIDCILGIRDAPKTLWLLYGNCICLYIWAFTAQILS